MIKAALNPVAQISEKTKDDSDTSCLLSKKNIPGKNPLNSGKKQDNVE